MRMEKGKTYPDIAADVPDVGESCSADHIGAAECHDELVVGHEPGEGGRPASAV
jgi:hypothetical protein